MPEFAYAGRRRDGGQPVRGRVEALDAGAAAKRLHAEGVVVTGLSACRERVSRRRLLEFDLSAGRVGPRDLALFCHQAATLLGAGVPLLSALGLLARPERGRSGPLQRLVARVAARVSAGGNLTAALEAEPRQIPPVMARMVAAGEAGGVLVEALQRAADQFERDLTLSGKVRSALLYPAVVAAVALAVVFFMVAFVLPEFARLYGQLAVPLPVLTRLLLAASHVLRRIWYLLALAAAGLAGLAVAATRRPAWRQVLDGCTLRVPVMGELARKWALARFARTLAALLRAGVTLLAALPVAAQVMDNGVLAAAAEGAAQTVRQGGLLSQALHASGQVPPMLVRMVAVGEETGALDGMLDKAAVFYEREVDVLAGRLTALLEPAVMLVLGGLVGFVLLAALTPMYGVFSKFE